MWPVNLTGKTKGWPVNLPNQFGHCPLTGRYFEPCGIHFILKSSNQVLQNITLHIKYMYNRLEPQVKNNVKFADSI